MLPVRRKYTGLSRAQVDFADDRQQLGVLAARATASWKSEGDRAALLADLLRNIGIDGLALQDRRERLIAPLASDVRLPVPSQGLQEGRLRQDSATVLQDVALNLGVADREWLFWRPADGDTQIRRPSRC